jgi:hypothetical protein
MPCREAVKPEGSDPPEPFATLPEMVTLPAGEAVPLVAGVGEPVASPFEVVEAVEVKISAAVGAGDEMGVSTAPGGGVISSAREKLQAASVKARRTPAKI